VRQKWTLINYLYASTDNQKPSKNMTTKLIKTLGVDVSKSSITCHILTQYPSGGLKSYWQKTRVKANILYPTFWSIPKHNQKSAFDFADYLKEEKPDYAVIEPTGNHYSRLWSQVIKTLGIEILWVGHIELRRYRLGKNLPNKSDPADALAMAAYALDPENHLENGELNIKQFLMHRPEKIDELREVVQQLEHLCRVQSPIINYTRQVLAWQFPEKASSSGRSSVRGNVTPLWGWLADRKDKVAPAAFTRITSAYQQSAAVEFGLQLNSFTKLHAGWLCDIDLEEQRLESQLEEILKNEEFKLYNEVFDQLGFGLRIKSRILSRIYPIDAFLVNGRELIEHEVREVKKKEITREDGQLIVKFSKGDTKRVKRNRSRDAFKLRLGMGTVLEQSGDKLVEKASGSALCRMTFWQHVITKIEIGGRLPDNAIADEVEAYKLFLKEKTDSSGKQLLNGRHVQSKLMSKVANLLFRELVRKVVKGDR
jgi:hypothetical protein